MALSVIGTNLLWHMGNVPFVIDPSFGAFSAAEVASITSAIAEWNTKSKVFIFPRTQEAAYVAFVKDPIGGAISSGACFSTSIGTNGSRSEIRCSTSLNSTTRTIIHEIGHALGLFHEHTRPDRDSFVLINWANVKALYRRNFDMVTAGASSSGSYDFASIMHYRANAASINGLPTIAPLPVPPPSPAIGTSPVLSPSDVACINTLYKNAGYRRIVGSVKIASGVAAARNQDGRLELFAVGTDGSMWHIWQTAGGPWSAWSSLGGSFTSGNPAVISNADGRLEVFCRNATQQLVHVWQVVPNGSWSSWSTLAAITTDVAVGRNKNGSLEVFAGVGGRLGHIWQSAAGGSWGAWTDMNIAFHGNPCVAANQDGRLELFYRLTSLPGNQIGLWHVWQNTPSGSWSSPESLGGAWNSDIAVVSNNDGRLEVFMIAADTHLYRRWQVSPNGTWTSQWVSLGGNCVGRPSATINLDGRLEVFVRGSDNMVYHAWQTAPGGSWSTLKWMGGPIADVPVLARDSSGKLIVFVQGNERLLYERWQKAPNVGWEKE